MTSNTHQSADAYSAHAPLDLVAIEQEARSLRAQALAEIAVAARGWVARLFAGRTHHA
ncbi:MAG: hypothetical protein AAFR47_05315 [Pseudomonadota bacterium]